ncbi:MAG: hypothetical protein ACJAX3_002496 [Patiriisocius sp.]
METTKQLKIIKPILLLLMTALSITLNGQTIIGKWETFDDKTNEKKAIVEIYNKDNLYFAKIVETFIGPKNATCQNCKGTKKDKPIIGLVITQNISKNGNKYDGGTILDPESGVVYNCYLKLIDSNKLKVRGFIGFSIFGRTQYWHRKK